MHNAAWAVTSMGTRHRKYTTRAKQADTRHPHDVESREQQRLIIIAPYIYFCMLTGSRLTQSHLPADGVASARTALICCKMGGAHRGKRESKDKARNEWSVVVCCFFAFAMGDE
jgi:hypothetical protein